SPGLHARLPGEDVQSTLELRIPRMDCRQSPLWQWTRRDNRRSTVRSRGNDRHRETRAIRSCPTREWITSDRATAATAPPPPHNPPPPRVRSTTRIWSGIPADGKARASSSCPPLRGRLPSHH